MVNIEERLLNALAEAHRLRLESERHRQQSELLLSGLRALLSQNSPHQMFADMFEVFGKLLPYRVALVLGQLAPDYLICRATTERTLERTRWPVDEVFKRVLQGQSCALNVDPSSERWQDLVSIVGPIQSVLYSPIFLSGERAILVFGHEAKDSYHQEQVQLVERFSAFTAQTLMNVKARHWADEAEQLREDKRKAELTLLQTEKMASIGQLAAGVAHEINNPIGFVTSNLSYLDECREIFAEQDIRVSALIDLLDRETLNPQCRQALESLIGWRQEQGVTSLLQDFDDILKESAVGLARVKDIVTTLRNFARKDEATWQRTDVNECITTTLKMVSNELKYHCQVHLNLLPLPQVVANPGKLNQVLTNLLVNASQAIRGKGNIWVESRPVGMPAQGVEVIIRDDGHGIPRDSLVKVFEPFFTTKEAGKGTGLGLPISFNIMQEHGGNLLLDSELNVGTTFTLFLPLYPPGVVESEQP